MNPKKANFLAMNVYLKWLMTGEALKKYSSLKGEIAKKRRKTSLLTLGQA